MSRLVITNELLSRLRSNLLGNNDESCAILLGRSISFSGKLARIIIRHCEIPEETDYSERSPFNAQLRPEYVAKITKRARNDNQSLVFVHTHKSSLNSFSSIDDEGESKLAIFLKNRIPYSRHASLLITPEANIARELGRNFPLRVIGLGENMAFSGSARENLEGNRYDRQIRAFGKDGQHILESLRIGIVGLGGTGSVVLQQLAHLGVRDFLLLDPDNIEETNLNRLVGSSHSDVGRSKVDLAVTNLNRINPGIRVESFKDSILRADVLKLFADTDFIFCCTDSHGSRAVLNQFSYQYLVPVIDMGLVIIIRNGRITHIAGRSQMLAPGLACLTCGNMLDSEQVRRDLLSEYERKTDPYIPDQAEPSPAVISLNSTISSLSVTMFLNAVLNVPGSARYINYDAISGVCRPVLCTKHPSCIVCSSRGALARADEWSLPAREE